MTSEEFIVKKLNSLRDDKVTGSVNSNLADEIFRLLMSKKFRKYSVTPGYENHILSAVQNSIANNEPIKLTFVFGGYKLWRLEESPEVDWAELFSLMYYVKWLKPICEIYKPGVWFDFYSDDVILELMDNVPKADTEAYIKSFQKLLLFIKGYSPKNLNFTLNRVGDQYENYEDFKSELTSLIEKTKAKFQETGFSLNSEQISAVDLNVKLQPEQDNDPSWREKVFLIHEAYVQVSKRRPYYRTSDKIMLITRPVANTLAIGTTKKSVMKFWIGAGILEKDNDGFIENILSVNQLKERKCSWEELQINGLEGKNFSKIRISS